MIVAGIINSKIKQVLTEIITLLFIALWAYVAVDKLFQLQIFEARLDQFPFVRRFTDWLVYLIPSVELSLAFLFFFSRLRSLALYFSLALLLIYTSYLLGVINFATSIPCTCNAVIASFSWNQHIMFNVGWILLAFAGIALQKKEPN